MKETLSAMELSWRVNNGLRFRARVIMTAFPRPSAPRRQCSDHQMMMVVLMAKTRPYLRPTATSYSVREREEGGERSNPYLKEIKSNGR